MIPARVAGRPLTNGTACRCALLGVLLMDESRQLLHFIRTELRAQRKTHQDLARALGLAAPSIKRLLQGQGMSLARLEAIGRLLGYTLAELAARAAQPAPAALNPAQEAELVADPARLLVAVAALNQLTVDDMLARYTLSRAACVGHLLALERLGILDLLPGDRIRLRVAREFDWLPDGPIQRYFRARLEQDFLAAGFEAPGALHLFSHGMLSRAAVAELEQELQRLRQLCARLHARSLAEAPAQRVGYGLLLALREWEPAAFAALRRPVV